MKEEYLDIVNEKDEIIGRETRKKIHESKLCHREIVIFIVNNKNELLVQKRSQKKTVNPGKWSFPVAGHLDCGEYYEETAKREAYEELGIKFDNLKLIGIEAPFEEDTENRRFAVFLARAEGPFKLDYEEVEEIKFFSSVELEKEIQKNESKFGKTFIRFFNKYKDESVKERT